MNAAANATTALPWAPWETAPAEPIRLGISACLLGERVAWDGHHRRDAWITGTLGPAVEFVPVCPEQAIGLGVPRPPIRLVQVHGQVRALGVADATLDATARLQAYGQRMGRELPALCGYILKNGSPSCGMEQVRLYRPRGAVPAMRGVGLYARELRAARPELPCEEETRLGDPLLRDHFLEQVFALHRWRRMERAGLSAPALRAFQCAHRLVLQVHDPTAPPRLERWAAGASATLERIAPRYLAAFLAALAKPATRRRHAQALLQVARTLRPYLDAADYSELREASRAYGRGLVPRLVPLTLLRHYLRRHPLPQWVGQVYLEPDPLEVALRGAG
ncbi:MAG TPA: DUF523 and DUF1722 domain-containing protein [bacterium]|nr:DUF523 and DUF1722 domain-containing protein [bacterium]